MIEILLALLAGILTVAAPCILPVLPIILGTSIGQQSRWRPFFIALGFVVTFSGFTMLFAVFSNLLGVSSNVLRTISIFLLLFFGVALIIPNWFEKITSKFTRYARKIANPKSGGHKSGFVLGATLGVVWTPCAGPILGTILTLVATQTDLARASILITAYAFGAGIPMIAIAYGGQYVTVRIKSISKYSGLLQRVFGVIIIALAIAMIFQYDILLQNKLLEFYPGGQLIL